MSFIAFLLKEQPPSRPRSGKTKVAYERPVSRTESVVHDRPVSRASQTDRSRGTVLSSTLRQYARSPTLISDKVYTNYARSRPSTRLSSRCNRSMTSSMRKNGAEANSAFNGIEPAFLEIRKDLPGLTIWRIENKNRILPLEESEHNFFHEGGAYIVLKVDEEEFASLHCWTGLTCPENEAKLAQEKANELDKIVNNANVFSSEVQGSESMCFMRLFPDGIMYIESKPRTSVNRATSYIKRMYKVTGKKYIRAACMPPSVNSLDSTSAFILDGHPRIYVWIGDQCAYCTRVKAINMAKKIRNLQRNGIAHIIVIDEKDEGMNIAFQKKLPNGFGSKSSLTSNDICAPSLSSDVTSISDLPCIPAPSTPELTQQERTNSVTLYRVSGDRVMYDMPEAAQTPLRHCYLVKRDSYMLDRGPTEPLFVWVGRQASESAISNAILRGKAFRKHNGYPKTLAVCRIMEEFEPVEFKKNFYDWREKDTRRRQLTKKYSIGNIERALFSRGDNRTVAKMDECWSDDVFPDGDPVTKIWQVKDDKLEVLPWDQHGVFFNAQCYVILHRIHEERGLQQIIYYWMGSKSSATMQQKTVDLVLDMNKSMKSENVVIRVLDEKEPQHFLSTIQNSIIVYDDDVQDDPSDLQVFCVREFAQGSMRVQQVLPSTKSLNSSASFIVMTPEECFVWYGKNSGGPEREYAKNMLGFLNPSRMYTFEIVTDGKESNSFWDILGCKTEYPNEFVQERLERRGPRLVHCDVTDIVDVRFSDIDRLHPNDLSDRDVMVLDTFDQVFLWVGSSIDDGTRKQLFALAQTYISRDPAGRNFTDVSLWMTSQSHEPETFVKHFRGWYYSKYSSQEMYDKERKTIRQENAQINVEQQRVSRDYHKCTKYDYKTLLREELPEDVQEQNKVNHLSDSTFKDVTRHSRSEFYRLPQWKQNQILKSIRLAYIAPIPNPLLLEKMTSPREMASF